MVNACSWSTLILSSRRRECSAAGPSELPNGTVLEVLRGELDAASAATTIAPGVDLIGSRRELAGLELALVSELEREQFLVRALDDLHKYDMAIVETPPNLGLLTINALFGAPEVLAPVSTLDPGAVQGTWLFRLPWFRRFDGYAVWNLILRLS